MASRTGRNRNDNDCLNDIAYAAQVSAGIGAAPTSSFKNLGANATLNVKPTTGKAFSLSCMNANASVRYIQLHDTATVPASSDPPLYSFQIAANGQTIVDSGYFTQSGVTFANGIAFAFSTTANTYTAGSAADQSTFIQYN